MQTAEIAHPHGELVVIAIGSDFGLHGPSLSPPDSPEPSRRWADGPVAGAVGGMLFAVRFLLVHSPVVGPSTWRWVAEALRGAGQAVTVPDLVAAAVTGDPAVFVGAAIASCEGDDDIVVVGHSGAGPLLPLVVAGLATPPRSTVFVDAGFPPCEEAFALGGDFLATLEGLATDGLLPIWSQWWGSGVLAGLVPLAERRGVIESELSEVPLSFYETVIEVPSSWCDRPGAYVLLSEAYRDDARRASALGWPVVERRGGHLDIVNDGEAIASILLDLVDPSRARIR